MQDKLRLLIVEDEEPIRRGLIDVFVYHGYEVDSAGDGQEGLELALNNRYHLILLDVMLPGLDGFSVCNKVREKDREQQKQIFDLFYRGEDELTRATPGTGIGLALVKELAESMGSTIQLVHHEQGAEFQIIFTPQ